MEATLCLLKPDTFERGLDEDILIKLTRDTGLEVIASKILVATVPQIRRFCGKPEEWLIKKGEAGLRVLNLWTSQSNRENALVAGKEIVDQLVAYLTRGEIMALVLRGQNAIQLVMELCGDTEPISAKRGTIWSWSTDSYYKSTIQRRALENLIHRSDSESAFLQETPIFFQGFELLEINNKIGAWRTPNRYQICPIAELDEE